MVLRGYSVGVQCPTRDRSGASFETQRRLAGQPTSKAMLALIGNDSTAYSTDLTYQHDTDSLVGLTPCRVPV